MAADLSDYSGVVRSVQSFHLNHPTEGYHDVAYNFLVAPNGAIYEGRGWLLKSGANGTSHANAHYIAICYLGGPSTPFTMAARQSIAWLIEQTKNRFPIATDVQPHSRWRATACPGNVIRTWIASGLVADTSDEAQERKRRRMALVTTDIETGKRWLIGVGSTRHVTSGEDVAKLRYEIGQENEIRLPTLGVIALMDRWGAWDRARNLPRQV